MKTSDYIEYKGLSLYCEGEIEEAETETGLDRTFNINKIEYKGGDITEALDYVTDGRIFSELDSLYFENL